MARLHYMALEGVGRWDAAIRETLAQLQPYKDFLITAKKATERRKPVLSWRRATVEEGRVFQDRLERRVNTHSRKAKESRKRRGRQLNRTVPSGSWVVLEPPPWRQEEPDETFEAFLKPGGRKSFQVYESPRFWQNDAISRLEYDLEGRALLLERLPAPYSLDLKEGEPAPGRPTAAAPFGPLIWLRPNTYNLERQLYALNDLEDKPPKRLAPLIRLLTKSAEWPAVEPAYIPEDQWVFLRPEVPRGPLRDGTEEQRRFVRVASATPDFAVLEGPPGSGKTTAICEMVVQHLRQGKRVLLVASTHVAVDNVLERLLAWQDAPDNPETLVMPIRVGEDDNITSQAIIPFTLKNQERTWRGELLDFLDSPKNVAPAGDAARALLRAGLKSDNKEDALLRMLLESANLICGTTIGILQHPAIKAHRRGAAVFEPFDLMILDEASKTPFAEFLVPALLARKWIIVGDIKQLSPYVEEIALADNIRGLLPQPQAQAAALAFRASLRGYLQLRSLVVTDEEDEAHVIAEAAARDVPHVHLDRARPSILRGTPGAIPELLYVDLVIGSARTLQRLEPRLPPDLLGEAGALPPLPQWRAARAAFITRERREGRSAEITDEIDWADEVSWRLVRSYELRQNEEERDKYMGAVASLLPVTLNEDWFRWRKMKPRHRDNRVEEASTALQRELDNIRRVAMPSVLELLQMGFERLPGWRHSVALTDGLPAAALRGRLVSLSFQHRMHPHISAFSREQFYTQEDPDALLSEPVQLLRDASTMEVDRAWGYARYARRAVWMEVPPQKKRSGDRKNSNRAEASKILDELDAFVEWASGNPRHDGRPWTVAVLSFYRGQEALLRDQLRRKSGLVGNTRNFWLPRNQEQEQRVQITLCTVDRFQGHEADLVLLSFVKSGSVGFLNSPNRLNVALTRARYQIVLIGHRSFFARCRSPKLSALAHSVHYARELGWEKTS